MENGSATPRFTRRVGSTLYDGRFKVVRHGVVCDDGTTVERDTVVHPGAVAVVAVDAEERFVFVRQYRAAVDRTVLELPAGTLEAGEDPATCAARELAEETGLTPGRLEALGSFTVAPGWCDETMHCFVATQLDAGARLPQSPEEHALDVEFVPRVEALRMIDDGVVDDAKSMLGILLYERLCRGGRLS